MDNKEEPLLTHRETQDVKYKQGIYGSVVEPEQLTPLLNAIKETQLSKLLNAGYKGPGEIEGEIQEAKKQERSAVVEEIKELCIPLDLISNNKGIALTFADLELLKSTTKGGGE